MRKRDWKPIFLAKLQEMAVVTFAAQAAGITRSGAYKARDRDPKFARRWQEALDTAVDMLEAKAHEVAFVGVLEPVYYKGDLVGHVRKYSVDMMKFLLAAHRPEKYRHNVAVNHAGKIEGGDQKRKVIFEFRDAPGPQPEDRADKVEVFQPPQTRRKVTR